jgi:hypothetical protein
MSHTYVQNLFHVVFSTKGRRKLIPSLTSLCRTYGAHNFHAHVTHGVAVG